MPFLFLSPSTQYFNPYITTGDERYWMNALADEMTPYLHASGITVTRNDPDGSAAQSIRDSNASRQDFHLALHSNAAPQALSGRLRGGDRGQVLLQRKERDRRFRARTGERNACKKGIYRSSEQGELYLCRA